MATLWDRLWLEYGTLCLNYRTDFPDFDSRISSSFRPTVGFTRHPVQWVPPVRSWEWGGRSVKPTSHLFVLPSACITAPRTRPYIVWSHRNETGIKYIGAWGRVANCVDLRWNKCTGAMSFVVFVMWRPQSDHPELLSLCPNRHTGLPGSKLHCGASISASS